MIKEGDIVIFKGSDNLLPGKWQEGDICVCVDIKKIHKMNFFKIKNTISNNEDYWHSDEKKTFYIYNWFYERSEWRDLQINLLND